MKNIKVSILIPAYNSAATIGETIRSAVNQTWENKEIIVVDDGSIDGTCAVASEFVESGVKVVQQPNRGASAARNLALAHATGDYIQWLDADDVLAFDKIARQLALPGLEARPRTLLSSGWGRFTSRIERATFKPDSLWANATPIEWMTKKMASSSWMAIESWLVSRQLTDRVGPWNETLSMDDDGEYFSRVVCASDGIRFDERAKSFVRRSNHESLSSNFSLSRAKLESQLRSILLQMDNTLALSDEIQVKQAAVRCLQNWLIFFYPEYPDLVSQCEERAAALGGKLHAPILERKYRLVRVLFGWNVAKRLRKVFPYWRARLVQKLGFS